MGKKSIYLLLAGLGFFFLKWKEDMNITLTHQPYVEKSQLPTASTGPLETGPGDTPSPLSETMQPTPTESAQPSIIQTSEPPAVVVPSTPLSGIREAVSTPAFAGGVVAGTVGTVAAGMAARRFYRNRQKWRRFEETRGGTFLIAPRTYNSTLPYKYLQEVELKEVV